MHFVLARDLGPIPGALTKNIQNQLAAANALRDKGQLDQALAAYEQIRDQNPKLTAMNLVVGSVYRKKASLESDPTARRALFDRARNEENGYECAVKVLKMTAGDDPLAHVRFEREAVTLARGSGASMKGKSSTTPRWTDWARFRLLPHRRTCSRSAPRRCLPVPVPGVVRNRQRWAGGTRANPRRIRVRSC
jgi:hypothetical protein